MQTRNHAVVIGGSIAGLLAARALTETFERVTIVERDRFPAGDDYRPGVPQARHVHVLTVGAQHILEDLFPGLGDELRAAGVPRLDQGWDVRTRFRSGDAPRLRSNLLVFSASRVLLETAIRRRVINDPKVRVIQGCEVVRLLSDPAGKVINGVGLYLRERSADATASEAVIGDFVVQAAGRASRLPDWLANMGYERPTTTIVNPHLGYASRWYRIPDQPLPDAWKGILIHPQPPNLPRGGILMPVDGGRWIVTLWGTNGDYPPTDDVGFRAFAESLPDKSLYEAIRYAVPASPIYGYRDTENRLVHYDRMRSWPQGLVVLGDAVCALNPSYGQGITVAAQSARILQEFARQYRPNGRLVEPGADHFFQKQLAKTIHSAWQFATLEDSRWPGTEGGKVSPLLRLGQGYIDQVIRLVPEQPEVYQLFLEMMQGVAPTSVLFRPWLVGAALRRALRGKSAAMPPPSPPATLPIHSEGD